MKKVFAYIVLLLLVFAAGLLLGRKGHKYAPGAQVIIRTDTLLVFDTIVRDKPFPVQISTIDTLYLPISPESDTLSTLDSAYFAQNGKLDTSDSAYLALPIERKVYEDDSLYRAVVTGYNAELESITVWPKTTIITTEKTVYQNQSAWSFGGSAGLTGVVTPSGRIYGGLGGTIGVTYRFGSKSKIKVKSK